MVWSPDSALLERYSLHPLQPQPRLRIARHAPVAARRQADRADLRPVRQARPLELVGEEALDEHLQPAAAFPRREYGLLELRRVRPGTGSSPAVRRSAGNGTGRSRAAHTGRSRSRSLAAILPSCAGRQQLRRNLAWRRCRAASAGPSPSNSFSAAQRTRNLTSVFGNADVRVVHADVIAVVGAPAQGQLRQVAGADDEAAVHRAARPHAGPARSRRPGRSRAPRPARSRSLAASVVDGQAVERDAERAMAQRPHFFQAEQANVDRLGRVTPRCCIRARALRERARRGAEAGHRQRLDFRRAALPSRSNVLQATSRASVESSPPEMPMVTGGLADVLQPFGQAGDLGVKDLLAAFARADPGRAAQTDAASTRPHQPQRRALGGEAECARRRTARSLLQRQRIGERVGLEPFDVQPFQVDVADEQRAASREARRLGRAASRSPRSAHGRRRRRRWSIRDGRRTRKHSRRCSGPIGRRPAAGDSPPCR